MIFLVTVAGERLVCGTHVNSTVGQLKSIGSLNKNFSPEDCYVTSNGRVVADSEFINDGQVYHIVPRLVGGKGGFGSMLRAIGAQIEKTTNHEACRDLSGRRMRDLNNEKNLREWVAQKVQREQEKEAKRQERLEKRKALPRHNFDDQEYHQQKQKVAENLDEALLAGLKKVGALPAQGSSSEATPIDSSRKRKLEETKEIFAKKAKEWFGVEINPEEMSDIESDDDDPENDGVQASCSSSDVEGVAEYNHRSSSSADPATSTAGSSACTASQYAAHTTTTNWKCSSSSQNKSTKDSCPNTADDLKNGDKSMNENSSSNGDDVKLSHDESSTKCGLLQQLSSVHPQNESEKVVNQSATIEPRELDLTTYESEEDLLELGLDRLKSALMALGLKCGGTLEERAKRLWSVRGLTKEQIDPSLFAKPSKGKGKKKKNN